MQVSNIRSKFSADDVAWSRSPQNLQSFLWHICQWSSSPEIPLPLSQKKTHLISNKNVTLQNYVAVINMTPSFQVGYFLPTVPAPSCKQDTAEIDHTWNYRVLWCGRCLGQTGRSEKYWPKDAKDTPPFGTRISSPSASSNPLHPNHNAVDDHSHFQKDASEPTIPEGQKCLGHLGTKKWLRKPKKDGIRWRNKW